MKKDLMDFLDNFFESCYDEKRGTLDFPLEWIKHFNDYGGDEFIERLNEWIEENKIPLPEVGHDEAGALQDFEKLKHLDALTLFRSVDETSLHHDSKESKSPRLTSGGWSHFLDYQFPEISSKQAIGFPHIAISLAGNVCSHYFNTPYRMKTCGLKSKSVLGVWNDPPFRLRALQMLKTKAKYPRKISSAAFLNILMNKGCSATNFKPSVAKAIYQLFGARKIYDFSAGWGDRLIAAMATDGVELYVGTDPNTDNRSLYTDILKTLARSPSKSKHGGKATASLHYEPAEDFHPAEIYGDDFDLAFTSCPYFNLEKYAAGTVDEKKQCWKKYSTVELWLNGFLFPALSNAIDCLKPGGFLAINLADFLKGDKRTTLCDPMNEFLSTRCAFCGCIGMTLHKRYGNYIKEKAGVHAEPIWIWQKLH